MKKDDLKSDPFSQFESWYEEAIQSKEPDPAAMTLSTVSQNGHPSARTVLYKGIRDGGFLVFTNYESRKSQDLMANPHAALTFYWRGLYRQIRIEAVAEKISYEESDAYFQTRSYFRQIGAWASPQSRPIEDRAFLINAQKKYAERYQEGKTPCPEHWGGFRFVPTRFEFWLGQEEDRLHDRFSYDKKSDDWLITRLAP